LFDVVAVVPVHTDAVQACLTARHLSFDIITFDLEGPFWMKKVNISRQKGSMASDREIYFEITYSAGLHGETPLENMVYVAHRLLEDACTKRIKNIIISSGAAKPEELRAPKDINSFGFLLGLDETASTQSVREHPLRIVQNAESRKHGKTWVTFKPFSPSVPAC
jgi:RNase P/RNase MRP subunit p30